MTASWVSVHIERETAFYRERPHSIERKHIPYLEHVGLVGFGAEELELQMLYFANVSSLGGRLVIQFRFRV
jgi:hypothetical protein